MPILYQTKSNISPTPTPTPGLSLTPTPTITPSSTSAAPSPTPTTSPTLTPSPTTTLTPTPTPSPSSEIFSITQQPLSRTVDLYTDQTPFGAYYTRFSVSVDATNYVSVTWQKSSDNGSSWTNIETNHACCNTPVSLGQYIDSTYNNTYWRAYITNGIHSIYTETAILTIIDSSPENISISSQPSDTTVNLDNTASFNIEAT